MGVYHIETVLFKLKQGYEESLFQYWKQQVHELVGVIPGLKYVDVEAPLASTAEKAKGFNVSLVAVMEKPEDALVYAEHPAHEKLIKECRSKLFDEVLVCDMPFQER